MKNLLLFLLLTPATLFSQATFTEEEKITHLIEYVRSLDAVFVRNGSEYSAVQAADHLQMKRKKAGKRIRSADDFITGVASKSYLSGEEYQIRFKNGKAFSSEMVLRLELKKLTEGRVKLLTAL